MATTTQYDSFIRKLKEIFMMDQADLDFGIYRIMNQKRRDIQQFLEHDLLPQVKQILKDNSPTAQALQQELGKVVQTLRDMGVNPDEAPKARQLKAQIAACGDLSALENEVYSHLTTFFSRYYDEGDFISKRRYKDNTYAIPYNGEEVKLYWANADQYYIKTSENFKDYSFRLSDGRLVHFTLKDATTEQNNNKTLNNQERRFALFHDTEGETPTVETIDGELHIYFTYELMPKTTSQKDLNARTLDALRTLLPQEWTELLAPVSDADSRPLVEKHLTDYTAKNTFDYFIHKNLGPFLRRELDFYIKNEVLHIDDLDTQHIQSQIATVKAIKGVGEKIIRMLAQLEDFQKKLWLKKKFVVQADYCITLDRVPRSLYPEICQNDAQREEWVRLFAIDDIKGDMLHAGYSEPLTERFLEDNPFLVLDTAFFSADFKHRLVSDMENIDEKCNGLLINSENFQALELLQEKYKESVKCIYIDPPYNTSSSEILYKNSYKHSSWLSLIQDRVSMSFKLMTKDAIQCTAIDDVECYRLRMVLENIFDGETSVVGLRTNPHGRLGTNGFSLTHEYALFSRKDENIPVGLLPRSEKQNARYKEKDEQGAYLWFPLQKTGSNTLRINRPTMFYPIFLNESTGKMRIPRMTFSEDKQEYVIQDECGLDEIQILPIKDDGNEGRWYFGVERAIKEVNEFKAVKQKDGLYTIYVKYRATEGLSPFTFWDDAKYSATEHGTALIKKMFGGSELFSYPKSIFAVEDCLRVLKLDNDQIVIDYFAGSGTTGHAVINLNREDEGNRKYILCEMGEYFGTVTKPRIEKVIYSTDWKNGKPVSRDGISQCFKYIRLEQYEDTLNNLVVKQPGGLFGDDEDGSWKETYMLGYMLDTETRGSLFNMQWFKRPFNMTLKTTKNNELIETPIDMVETFNFLIGLEVDTQHWHQQGHICAVEGRLHRTGEAALVIWRDCEHVSNEALNEFFRKMDYTTQGREFDVIYVNGDNTLPNLRRDEDHWKVVLTEEEFMNRMFQEE